MRKYDDYDLIIHSLRSNICRTIEYLKPSSGAIVPDITSALRMLDQLYDMTQALGKILKDGDIIPADIVLYNEVTGLIETAAFISKILNNCFIVKPIEMSGSFTTDRSIITVALSEILQCVHNCKRQGSHIEVSVTVHNGTAMLELSVEFSESEYAYLNANAENVLLQTNNNASRCLKLIGLPDIQFELNNNERRKVKIIFPLGTTHSWG